MILASIKNTTNIELRYINIYRIAKISTELWPGSAGLTMTGYKIQLTSYKKRSSIKRVYVAPIFLFGLFYVNTLKDENIFKLIRNISPYFDCLFGALFTKMKVNLRLTYLLVIV